MFTALGEVKGVSIDSRSLRPGELFIAIKGERFDGHDFIAEAVRKGASAAVVSRKIKDAVNVPVIYVPDTTKALGLIASLYRQQFNIPVIAITGSAGKTTTKEIIAGILEQKYKVLKNIKTENNQIGVSLTLLRLRKGHEAVVLELGTNHPGEIRWLAEIARPTIAVFTNIGPSHLQGLKSPRGVFKEKFSLVEFMPSSGVVIFNKDDVYLKGIAQKNISLKKISYAVKAEADVKIDDLKTIDQHIQFKVDGKEIRMKTAARHNAGNALAAICCARILNIEEDMIRKGLASFEDCPGRQEIKEVNGIWVINDSYNSNPISFQSALQTLDSFKTGGQKILVCADMLELGSQSRLWHERIGRIIARSAIDVVLTTGPEAYSLAQQVKKTNHRLCFYCRNREELHEHLRRLCRKGDVVLVKGSRAMKMEKTVDFLKGEYVLFSI